MAYDRIWIGCTDQTCVEHEPNEYEFESLGQEFNETYLRLRAEGNFVVLIAGKNHCFEEIFLFPSATTAYAFGSVDFACSGGI